MSDLETLKLPVTTTLHGKERATITIRLHGNYVASLCYTSRIKKGEHNSGFWVEFMKRDELTQAQIEDIVRILFAETQVYLKRTLGGQI